MNLNITIEELTTALQEGTVTMEEYIAMVEMLGYKWQRVSNE